MRGKRVLGRVVPALLALLAGACGQKAQTVTLRSLDASADLSFVCLGMRGSEVYARNLDDCPDVDATDSGEVRHLFSVVTQKNRGEVAVVDLTAGTVVDEEPSVPGTNFLPVGANPGAIVTTPGSVASFVGVAEPGKEGIFAIPTSCMLTRTADEAARDLTSWSACRLPSAPDAMALLVDSAGTTCRTAVDESPQDDGRECPARLSAESQPGRRKLVVSLPDLGGLAVIDAQGILNRIPGTYQPCDVEQWVPLRADARDRSLEQSLDGTGLTDGDRQPGLPHGDDPAPFSRAGGFAQLDDPITGEHRLFIADHGASVIHDIDTTDACALADTKPPLRPTSFLDPNRFVTTTRVAVSPLTTDHLTNQKRRFLYALDEFDVQSIMTFDVSPGSTNKTPLVRARAEWTPREPPDRIKFDAPVDDVTFGLRDRVALDAASGAESVGVLCDPTSTDTSIQTQYWPNSDFSAGAAASNLRGIFAFAALSTGTIAVIDVEDFDEKCRRPSSRNTGSVEDFRGCPGGDPAGAPFPAPPDPAPRVTNEVSCAVVEPNRPRSATLAVNDADRGVRAPSLRTRPKLIDPTGRSLSVDTSDEGKKHPHMLGVNFGPSAEEHAAVYIGTSLFETTSADNPLVIDPTKAVDSSLVLSFAEPRSYVPQNGGAAVYEGKLIDQRLAARFRAADGATPATFTDAGNIFCGSGIEDVATARLRGVNLGVDTDKLDTFATQHADMVVIKSELLDQDDAYWSQGAGAACGKDLPGAATQGFVECGAVFGTAAKPTQYRELRILKATVGRLDVEPRAVPSGTVLSDRLSALIECCFPEALSYEARVSNEWLVAPFEHSIAVDESSPDRHCVMDDGKLRSRLDGRVVEVSCNPDSQLCADKGEDANGAPTVTPRNIGLGRPFDPTKPATLAAADVACMVDDPATDTQTIGSSRFWKCIHQGLTTRFVIYRGLQASQRDMQFLWEVRGSFSPFTIPLATRSDPNSIPEKVIFSKQTGQLMVADGSTKGLMLIDLSSFATAQFY